MVQLSYNNWLRMQILLQIALIQDNHATHLRESSAFSVPFGEYLRFFTAEKRDNKGFAESGVKLFLVI